MRRTLRGDGAAIPQFDRSPNAEGHDPIAGARSLAAKGQSCEADMAQR